MMLLERKPLPRLHLDPLDLVAVLLVKDRVGTPGAFTALHVDSVISHVTHPLNL